MCESLPNGIPIHPWSGNRLFRYKVVSIITQAVRMHKNFVHFKYGLRVNNKNILGEYSSFFKRMAWNCSSRLSKLVSKQLCIETARNPSEDHTHLTPTCSQAIVNHKHTLIGFVGVRVDPFLPRFKFIQPPVCDAYYPVIVDHTMTRGKITVKLDGTVVQILHALQRKFPFKVTSVSFKICISKG